MVKVLAFDFGASSGRAILGCFDGESLACKEIHRFENTPITVDGHMCHDVDMFLREIHAALEKAGRIDSLAFDTWGVDYGLLGEDGRLLRPPYHYRDGRTRGAAACAVERMPARELYAETGSQIMDINTLFQLGCERLTGEETLLFMPDLFAYLLSGQQVCERSIASTSQMLNPVTRSWSRPVLERFGIDQGLFPPLVDSGTVLGTYGDAKVVAAAGHDTQCAVAAIPCCGTGHAFLSCGTWSLLGCELDKPVLTEESARLGLSNELGANGKVNYLKNISGLWLMQELRRSLAQEGIQCSYNQLENLARESEPFRSYIDPDRDEFAAPGDMHQKLRDYCRRTQQPVPETAGQLSRCIYESLALKYRFALEQIAQCTGRNFDRLHLLGGGVKDTSLCQLTADSLGIPVISGPSEATALGNILLQLTALGELQSPDQGRELLARTEQLKMYEPRNTVLWEEAYEKFKQTIYEEAEK